MSLRSRLLAAAPEAAVLARAPGRVNLIGEHTDYNGFPVLPFAIDRHVWVAATPRDDEILSVRNLDTDRYPGEEMSLAEISLRARRGSWVDYVVAAARSRPPETGLDLLVAGDVPVEAGLSSSSAVVVASMLVLGEPGDRFALAEESRLAERYVGTLSGGMDQAISLLAREGEALRIDFRPLRAKPVSLPESLAIVVAHSGVTAAKSGAAREAYNDRVRSCSAAAVALGAPPDGLLADIPSDGVRLEQLEDATLRRRAGFVFTEAERVALAVDALESADLDAFGALLNASHAGLRDDYEVSHPAVDALVASALEAGALGARVVGAGFGGCVVVACEVAAAERLVETLGPNAWRFVATGPARREELRG